MKEKEIEIILPQEGEILDIELEEDFLKRNQLLAQENRKRLDSFGITCIDVMGSIGSGKTTLLASLIPFLKDKYSLGILAGDLTTTLDAERLAREGVEVLQINTGKECHLDALLVKKALSKLPLKRLDLIFIENVGNLICPAEFPLGSHKRVVVISVTEGPWMVVKHPFIFQGADLLVINKIDLAQPMGVDPEALLLQAKKINPSLQGIKTDLKKGRGVKEIIKALGLSHA